MHTQNMCTPLLAAAQGLEDRIDAVSRFLGANYSPAKEFDRTGKKLIAQYDIKIYGANNNLQRRATAQPDNTFTITVFKFNNNDNAILLFYVANLQLEFICTDINLIPIISIATHWSFQQYDTGSNIQFQCNHPSTGKRVSFAFRVNKHQVHDRDDPDPGDGSY
jgi:hypothetical protein